MNELKELEKWLTTAIKANNATYEYAISVNDKDLSKRLRFPWSCI